MSSPPKLRVGVNFGVHIHPTAVVHPTASIGFEVSIGPYAIVEAGVYLGDRTKVMAHGHVCARTRIGSDCEIHMGAVLGHTPQIRGFTGDGGGLRIGARTIIREHVTVHRASEPDAETIIGSDVLLLGNSHVAHDCEIGDGVTLANGSLLAGNVTLRRGAFISGSVVIHQHVRVGELAIVGGGASVGKDVPPYMMAAGRNRVRGLNVVGMRRAGLPPQSRQLVRQAYGILYRSSLTISDAVVRLRAMPQSPEILTLIDFIQTSVRGLCGGPRRREPAPW